MSKQNIKKTTPPLEQRVSKIERALEAMTPQKLDPKLEADQEAHQAALTSFQTKREGGMCQSLNGLPLTPDQLKKLEQADDEKAV